MRKTAIIFLAWLALFVWAAPLRAQEPDTTQVAVDTTAAAAVQESLLPYKMQRRYRPVNRPFHEGGPLANSYISILGAGYRQMAQNYSYGFAAYGGVGKWLKPWHGVEVHGGLAVFTDNYNADRIALIALRASYLFNLSAYVEGYNPDRLVEFYPRAGLGASFSFMAQNESASIGLSAHLGMDVNMHIFPGIDLVVQPMLELQRDSRQLVRMDVWRNYLLAAQIGYGVRLTLDKERIGGDPGNDWFYTLSCGPQLQMSKYLLSEDRIRLGRAIGISTMAGVGRFYGDYFALRAQLGFGWHFWKEVKEGETDEYGNQLPIARFRSSYFVARAEGAVDVLGLLDVTDPDGLFKLSVLAGPEVGVLHKKDPYYKDIVTPYVGFTAAPQLKFRINSDFSVFLEPRVSVVPYSAHAFMTSTANRNYYDAVVSLSLGVEYRLLGKPFERY